MGSGPGNWASGEAHQLTEGAGDLPERVLHGGDIAGQHHRAGEAIEKTDLHRAGLGSDVAGDNRCFTGVMVRMPMAETASGRPSF